MGRDDKLAASMFLSNVNPQIANQDQVTDWSDKNGTIL